MDKAIDQSDPRDYLGGPRQVELQSYLRNQNSQHPQHHSHSRSQQRAATNTNNIGQQQLEQQQQTSLSPSASVGNKAGSPSHNYSSRAHFRQLTRDILNLTVESTTVPTTTAPEVPVTSLDPVKFDPMSSMRVPLVYDSHSSYSTTGSSESNGPHQTLYRVPEVPEPRSKSPPKAYSYPTDTSQHGRKLPQSKSENNVRSFEYTPYGNPGVSAAYYRDWEYMPRLVEEGPQPVPMQMPVPVPVYENQEPEPVPKSRGRQRSRSPVKILEDLEEDMPLDFSPRRRAKSPHKKLFGENGWLGRSPTLDGSPGEKKKAGLKSLGEKIKQRVEDMTGDVMKSSATPFQPRMALTSTFPISLDPPTQAKLYSEMELMICVSANQFLMEQYREGHMSAESFTKITNFWVSKNRPQVIQFQFDQATQRDLILYNLRSFHFHGECAINSVVLNATLYNWKTMAKEMSIRTFCYPDSMIRKHMHDTHKILEMLGAPLVTFLAFQELQMNALSLIKKAQEKLLHSERGMSNEYRPPPISKHN